MKQLLKIFRFGRTPKQAAEPVTVPVGEGLSQIRDPSIRRVVEKLARTIEDSPPPVGQPEAVKVASLLRRAPANDNQPDFFVPSLWDIAIKDGIGLMDVAVFRLARNNRRKGDMIEHRLRNLTIQVKSNYDGMATIEDYSIIMMMISGNPPRFSGARL